MGAGQLLLREYGIQLHSRVQGPPAASHAGTTFQVGGNKSSVSHKVTRVPLKCLAWVLVFSKDYRLALVDGTATVSIFMS